MSEFVIHIDTKEKLLNTFGEPLADVALVLEGERDLMRFHNSSGDQVGDVIAVERFLDHVRSFVGKRKPHIRSVDDDWMA